MSATATIADVLEGRARWCLIEGDNAEVLPALPAKSVAHVITDPPYEAEAHTLGRRKHEQGAGLGAASGRKVLEAPLSFSAMTPELRLMAGMEMARLANRWVIVFAQVEGVISWRDALTHTGEHGARRIGVWVKPDAMPQLTGDRPGMGYESIVFTHRKGRSFWNGGGRVAVFTHNKNTPGGAHHHETQKPLPLMLELVELFTDPGEVVLDPFAGSGTTGVACLRSGRRFIGIERDPKYAQVARDRLAAESVGLTLRDARAGQQSLFGEVAP
jgi:site-specific DNA-methyltransferase (adenine-specific)